MRDTRIDFAKGMLMLCVVYGHAINALLGGTQHSPVWLHGFVRTFDMPFFMVLSGCFLRRSLERRSAVDVALNRLSMIALPATIWTLLFGHVTLSMYYFLWAVLASSLICVIVFKVCSLLPCRLAKAFEFILHLCTMIAFYMVKTPWNLFYLFPFFIFGYYVRDAIIATPGRLRAFLAIVFVIALCFWKTAYTPWRLGAFAWKDDHWAIAVYAYRFVLGIAGVAVMSSVFRLTRTLFGEGSIVVKTITECGRETLALYILQSIVIERFMGTACKAVHRHYPVVPPQSVVNLVGYIIAPAVAFVSIAVLLRAVGSMKRTPLMKYAFGVKIK